MKFLDFTAVPQKYIININELLVIMETNHVFFEVRTGCLNIVYIDFMFQNLFSCPYDSLKACDNG
jgi:hypothetical protein